MEVGRVSAAYRTRKEVFVANVGGILTVVYQRCDGYQTGVKRKRGQYVRGGSGGRTWPVIDLGRK